MTIGPNVKSLITRRMASTLVPSGGGIQAALSSLAKTGAIGAAGKEAITWVTQAIAVFKTAPDNPFGDDDEAIAGHILERLKKRIAEQIKSLPSAETNRPSP